MVSADLTDSGEGREMQRLGAFLGGIRLLALAATLASVGSGESR